MALIYPRLCYHDMSDSYFLAWEEETILEVEIADVTGIERHEKEARLRGLRPAERKKKMNPFTNNNQQTPQQPQQQQPTQQAGGDAFDLIAQAQVWGEGIKMNPEHNYLLELENFKVENSTQNRAMTNYIFEFKVIDSDDQMLVGKTIGHVEHSTSQGFDSRLIKIFLFLWGKDANDAAIVESARPHIAQIMRDAKDNGGSNGKRIVAQTQPKRTAKNNYQFMPISWSAAA